ncbi:MAG: ABC transporter substrate-binding protein [Lachnospiraceae bacterium]|nr:ABC transporter substrate-binding protein [Lachnospiraceae bacterium]
MKRKIVSAILCMTIAVTACAGCGSTSKEAAGDNSEKESTSGSASAASTSSKGSKLDPVTLHFIFFGDKKSATDDVWNAIADYTREELNCDFDVQFIAGDDYKSKILVKAATGDSWDMNFDSDWTGYFQMVEKDAYLDLDDLLPEYAPDLYAKYKDSGVIEAAKSKGHIVALPWTMTMNNRPFFQWRGDLADAAGIKIDKDSFGTIEDMDQVLTQLKEAYPDKYILENSRIIGTMEGYSVLDQDKGLYFKLDDPTCKVVAIENTKTYEEMAKYAEKWQKEGIIWKDVLTDKLDHNSLINQGKLIAGTGTHEFSTQNRPWVEENAHWDYAELYPDGLFANRTPLANAMCISATSENPERTLMFLNMIETDQKLYDMVQYGIEGETYQLDGEMAAYPDGMDSASSNYMEWGGQWALWKPQFMRPNASYGPEFWTKEAEFAASKDVNVVSPLDGFCFNAENVTTEAAQRNQIFGDSDKLINVGLAGDYKEAIDTLKKDTEAAGLQTLLEEYQKQVDEYLAQKK